MSPRKRNGPAEFEAVQQARAVGGLSERCIRLSGALRERHQIDPSDVQQVQQDFVTAYTSAQARVSTFEAQVAAFRTRFSVEATCRPGGVKKLERIVEKYSTSLQLPLDLLAAKVVVDNLWQLYNFASEMPQVFSVVAYRDRVVFDQRGYRDLQFIVDVDGHYAEVKLMHRLMDQMDGFEHRIYEIRRSLIARQNSLVPGTQDPVVLTPIEQLVLDKLRATSADLFNDAWKMVLAAEDAELQGGKP